ncbi:MAG: hypothetical protein WHT06_15955 [Desulfobacterales bacterium]
MSEELRNLSQEIKDLIEAERVKAMREAAKMIGETRSWFERNWRVGWGLFAFVVLCAALWAVTR